MKRISSDRIRDFWEWFSEVADELAHNLDNPRILGQLDERISALKDRRLSWEVGAGKEKEKMLVISPSGDEKLLPFTEAVVMAAPTIPKWEFWPSKPAKQWDGTFEFQTEAGMDVVIDSARWEYALLKFDDGTFDIFIKSVGLSSVTGEDALNAAGIALDGYLGEKVRIEAIKNIDVVNGFEDALAGKTNRFPILADHLASMGKS